MWPVKLADGIYEAVFGFQFIRDDENKHHLELRLMGGGRIRMTKSITSDEREALGKQIEEWKPGDDPIVIG